ncbi:MAG: hypothetical protein JW774_01480, partial [Candidatus Aureabacteria bacterium]|nr:hypothetical protein [Candidatus Auribacterota bacterium]
MAYREILGQEIVKDILTRFAASGKIPHALLFVGPPGTQKRETAAEFARILLCEASPSNGEACGSCQGCHLFELNSHPDVFFLNPKGKMRHVKMDETRELLRFLSLKPYLEKYKIAVLPDADTLSDASGNAILKFLEEPPE